MVHLKTLFELGFHTVSEEAHLQQIQSERRKFSLLEHVSTPPKRKAGRPKKKVQLDTVLQVSMKMEDVVISKEETSRTKKYPRKRRTNVNWFKAGLWPPLEAVLKSTHYSPGESVTLFRRKFGLHETQNPYLHLIESTILGWLQYDELKRRKVLKPRFQTVIDLFYVGYDKKDIGRFFHSRASAMWAGHSDLQEDFCKGDESVERSHSCGFQLTTDTIPDEGIILTRCPEILKENGGRFEVSRTCVKKWIKTRLGWSYREHTTPGRSSSKERPCGVLQGMQMLLLEYEHLLTTGFDSTAYESHWTTHSTLHAFVQRILVLWIMPRVRIWVFDVVTQKT
ncbi:hypothetical protein R1flu_023507 [Riccia fluitans]|uniref:Transposase n=1 Tax=Riccia fluitans TaxID=41844 RepID=A0ABD1XSR2_9MARC